MTIRGALALLIGSLLLPASTLAQAPTTPRHLSEARKLVQHLDLKNTNYEHGTPKVVWEGVCESHTDCSGFIDALLTRSYGYDADAFKRWFDSRRPSARRYHDAIAEQRGFVEIKSVASLLPGDLLAIKYLVQKENTGHVMLVADAPRRITPKEPLVAGSEQWQVAVIDSSHTGHGSTDTRHKKGADGKDHDGLGQGVFRIYSNGRGEVIGFAWSTLNASKFQQPQEEHLVIGRLKPGFQP